MSSVRRDLRRTLGTWPLVDQAGVPLALVGGPPEVEQGAGDPEGVVGVAIPLLYVIPISLVTRYRITRARHAEIQAALAARRLTESG